MIFDRFWQFVDGNGLLSCERVSYRWRLATDRTSLWKVSEACSKTIPVVIWEKKGGAYR